MRVVGRGGGIVAPTSRGHARQLYGCGEVIRDAVARPQCLSPLARSTATAVYTIPASQALDMN